MKPMDIERQSFEIIARELGERQPDPEVDLVVRRVIHTTADFDYFDNLTFSPHAVQTLQQAIRAGRPIVTDTTMAMAGINKKLLGQFGCQVHCFIGDGDVAAEARERGLTRSWVSMEKAAQTLGSCIFAIGNAPTALFAIRDLTLAGKLRPQMVIGAPVGFVNVVEAKEAILSLDIPHIVARGRKGGSNVAAAIVNAALYQMVKREE